MSQSMDTSAAPHSSLSAYIVGFGLSILLTVSAFITVTDHLLHGWHLIAVIIALAIAQVCIQLIFFLHLGRERKPRWKMMVFLFMLLVLGILVFGSLWIMQNLNYNMTPQDMLRYLNSQDGF